MWQTVNKYFAIRHRESLELEAITNYKKIKEQSHILTEATDVNGVKEHLMFKLQEQLRGMYPNSLKYSDSVDDEIAKDINASSEKSPLMWDPEGSHDYLNEQLAFPSVFSHGWLGTLGQVLTPRNWLEPIAAIGASVR